VGVWPSAFNGAATTLHWVTNKNKKNNSNKKQKQRQSSGVCATASIDVGDRAAQTILRSRYSSKVNSGYGRALGALVSRWLMSKTKVSSKKTHKKNPQKIHINRNVFVWWLLFVAGSAGACLHKQMQHNSSDQMDYLRLY